MTHREFYTVIANGNFDAELVEFATNALTKLDAQGERAAVRRAEKSNSANADLIVKITDAVKANTDVPMTASIAAELCGVSTQKASAVLRKMVANGTLRGEDILVTGEKGSVKCKGYFIVEG